MTDSGGVFPTKVSRGVASSESQGGARSPILPHFLENSLFIAFLCDNFLDFPKSGGSADPSDPLVTTPLVLERVIETQKLAKFYQSDFKFDET